MVRFAIIVNILFVFSIVNGQTDYCRFCSSHLACTRRNVRCGIDRSCGSNARQIILTNEDIRNILDQHNSLRSKVAMGHERTHNQPSAANMNALNYNKELGYIAQCLTNTCKFQHDQCRKTAKYSWVGQNIGIRKFMGTLGNYKSVIKSTIDAWYNEVKDFDRSWVHSFNNHGRVVGHYTQVVWANTKEIGCAMTFYVQNGWNSYLFACNYGPGGNLMRQSLYKMGGPATQCARQPVNRRFSGLCGNDFI